MNDIALRRPRKSALLWCRHEDIRPLRDERYKRCVLVVILYFALRNAREGLGKTALTASTAGLGGAGTAQGGRSISLSPAASVPVSMTGNPYALWMTIFALLFNPSTVPLSIGIRK